MHPTYLLEKHVVTCIPKADLLVEFFTALGFLLMVIQNIYEPDTFNTHLSSGRGTLVNDKLFVFYNEQSETLEIKWEGAVSSYEVRQGYALIMEFVQQYKPVKWLLDFQNREKIKRSDQRWVFTSFFPEALRVVENDVFVAVILPIGSSHELVNELNGDELIYEDNFMIINHFIYSEAAQRWLALEKNMKAGA